ncbi:hypothetical protein BC829DRAFT_407702 [Chytridium lagenaria]|nr:hypothetical protein BC829DRAFT_407702 [Chytridium lagenaria]
MQQMRPPTTDSFDSFIFPTSPQTPHSTPPLFDNIPPFFFSRDRTPSLDHPQSALIPHDRHIVKGYLDPYTGDLSDHRFNATIPSPLTPLHLALPMLHATTEGGELLQTSPTAAYLGTAVEDALLAQNNIFGSLDIHNRPARPFLQPNPDSEFLTHFFAVESTSQFQEGRKRTRTISIQKICTKRVQTSAPDSAGPASGPGSGSSLAAIFAARPTFPIDGEDGEKGWRGWSLSAIFSSAGNVDVGDKKVWFRDEKERIAGGELGFAGEFFGNECRRRRLSDGEDESDVGIKEKWFTTGRRSRTRLPSTTVEEYSAESTDSDSSLASPHNEEGDDPTYIDSDCSHGSPHVSTDEPTSLNTDKEDTPPGARYQCLTSFQAHVCVKDGDTLKTGEMDSVMEGDKYAACIADALQTHLPYACTKCTFRFCRKNDLKRHLESHNKFRQKKYVCRNCGKPCSRSDALKRHRTLCTGEAGSRNQSEDESTGYS